MWPNRTLCDLLGIEHPIIQAPMAGSDTAALAAAVANAGGLGSIGCAMMSPERFRAVYAETRAATNRAVNMNFFAHAARRARAAPRAGPAAPEAETRDRAQCRARRAVSG